MVQGPFTADDKKKLDEALNKVGEAERAITQAKLAKIDTGDADVRARELKEKLTAIKNVYFKR